MLKTYARENDKSLYKLYFSVFYINLIFVFSRMCPRAFAIVNRGGGHTQKR